MKKRRYTGEEKAYIRNIAPGHSYKKIVELFNNTFENKITLQQVSAFLAVRKLSNGLSGRFEKGHNTWNKGRYGVSYDGMEPTQFKKGQMPHNYKKIGSEYIDIDGYTYIKIANPKKWRLKHVVVWEQTNGPVPKGHCVIFGDGDKRNFEPENLILVSRTELLTMNRHGLIGTNADLTKTGVLVADMIHKTSERRKGIYK